MPPDDNLMLRYSIDDLSLPISRYCPGKCLNCNIYKKDPLLEKEISLGIYGKLLSSSVLENTSYFSLTGGESQLSPKFIDILKLIQKTHPSGMIHSNISGWYLSRHREVVKAALEYFDADRIRVDISVDGIRQDYEKVRLKKDGWEKMTETTKVLKSMGIWVTYVMIVYKENFHSIKPFIQMCHEREVGYYIGFCAESSIFNNTERVEHFSESDLDEIETVLGSIGFLKTKHRVNWEWAKASYGNTMPEVVCHMGQQSLLIDPYGNVYPCGGGQIQSIHEHLFMGNIKDFDGDLDQLLSQDQAFRVLTNIKEKKCQPCTLLCAHKIEFPWGKGTGMV